MVAEPVGREVRYRLTPAPFADAMGWMASAGARWDERLARLERPARRARYAGSTDRAAVSPSRPALMRSAMSADSSRYTVPSSNSITG